MQRCQKYIKQDEGVNYIPNEEDITLPDLPEIDSQNTKQAAQAQSPSTPTPESPKPAAAAQQKEPEPVVEEVKETPAEPAKQAPAPVS